MRTSRADIDQALTALRGYLPTWRAQIRHEAQFWPQLRALLAPALEGANADDAAYAGRRVLGMLIAADIDLEPGGEVVAWLRAIADEGPRGS